MPKATHRNNPIDYARAKKLRRESTPFEQKLWCLLQPMSKKAGFKFRRQHPLRPYIADFVCLDVKLIIELDGISHDTRQDYDQMRNDRLSERGFKTLRFSNNEVVTNLEGIVETILIMAQTLLEKKAVDHPSPAKAKGLASQTQAFASSPARGEE